jgi:hypothetical protein
MASPVSNLHELPRIAQRHVHCSSPDDLQIKERAMLSKEAAHDWVAMMRAEYLEMPGLALSKQQARRLWGLDSPTCDQLLNEMISTRFLRKTNDELYVLADAAR